MGKNFYKPARGVLAMPSGNVYGIVNGKNLLKTVDSLLRLKIWALVSLKNWVWRWWIRFLMIRDRAVTFLVS
jgi:hypothetical protein